MAKSATQTKPEFKSILSMPAQDAERPPTLPRGYYSAVVEGWREDKSSEKQTPFTRFDMKILSVWEKDGVPQVDEEALEEFGDVNGTVMPLDFYHTEKSIYRLREFLEHCGIDLSDGKSFEQAIPETRNCEVIVQIAHQSAKSGDGTWARIIRTLPMSEDE